MFFAKVYYKNSFLELVNAASIPIITLHNGIWNVGEHSLKIDIKSIQSNSYIVVRRNTLCVIVLFGPEIVANNGCKSIAVDST